MFSTQNEFQSRHIGPNTSEVNAMLSELGYKNLEEMAKDVIPANIVSKHKFEKLGHGLSEFDTLAKLQNMVKKNKVYKSFIGMGYHDTITPSVILRCVLENPVWYTAYTPYQPEISQGRLEALLNFQTMVSDLTAMEIANASLLDEGTAAAEAMAMAHNLAKNKSDVFLASPQLHPHVLELLKTRSEPMGLKMVVTEPHQFDLKSQPVCAAIMSYPNTDGQLVNWKETVTQIQAQGGLAIFDVDLLALTLLTPPGEWGADIVVGNSQRFGVPLGNGGPHAAFLATKDAYKRLMPGRLVGVSIDAEGKKALRLALQTREQHIRREKATSNICTAQVLLANMASMYAVHHGPEGLKNIALRIHNLGQTLATGLKKLGLQVSTTDFFDTVKVEVANASQVLTKAESKQMNFSKLDSKTVLISINETTSLETIQEIWSCFADTVNFNATEISNQIGNKLAVADNFKRQSKYLSHPVFNSHHSETQMMRYIHTLANKDLTLTHSMIPLGSCTMKLNAATELLPVSWKEINGLHPFAPTEQMLGSVEMIKDLENQLADITGFAAVTLQPNAGSQGEYSGLMVIRKYHQSRNEGHRNICLIPSSAHGTNPATAVMCGMQVVVVACDEFGNVDVNDLKTKAQQYEKNLAALMITYPSTHGVFEEAITEICDVIHKHGGQVYMDGANLNALVAICRPGEFGPDVSHMNLHKTFSIPHGGGGPGVGPIGVGAHLKDFLPTHALKPECGPAKGITAVSSAPWGSASILPIPWAYITMMGYEGLKHATLVSILSANYIAKKLNSHFPVLYKGRKNLVAHECIIDLRPIKKTSGIDVTDVAKRLMDYGFHAPTMSFPVAGTLMIEPTESESKAELDRFIDAMISIRAEIAEVEKGVTAGTPSDKLSDNPLQNAPHTLNAVVSSKWNHSYTREQAAYPRPWVSANKYWPTVGRVDNAYGDKNIVCACPPIESYQ
jgi:glycine dehydrogenase